jgi:hypothetical protein
MNSSSKRQRLVPLIWGCTLHSDSLHGSSDVNHPNVNATQNHACKHQCPERDSNPQFVCRPQMNQPVQPSEITIMKPVTYVQMRYKEKIAPSLRKDKLTCDSIQQTNRIFCMYVLKFVWQLRVENM